LRLADALTGGAVLGGAALLLWQAQALPPMPGQRFGPSTFPTVIAFVMGGAGALILARGLRSLAATTLVEIGPLAHDRRAQAAFLWLVLGLAAMLLLWRPVASC
jgi:hypothetical protein